MGTVKILLSGDPQGKLDALFKRVTAVNKSSGPFDVLLCVGAFFSPSGADDADYQGELVPYLTGEKQAPMPTYFIGGFGGGARQALEALSAAPDCNIHYLGRCGVKAVAGLSVAFLDGTYNSVAWKAGDGEGGAGRLGPGCRHYNEEDVAALRRQVGQATGDIDLLLTNEWPVGVCNGIPEVARPQGPTALGGSAVAAELALAVRPRYHVAGGRQVFYARPPYLNADLGAGSHVTRFISLAEVGNANKQKSLHALGLVPASEMTQEALQAVPEGTTQCPYTKDGGGGRKRPAGDEEEALGEQIWRWQQKRQKAPMAAPSLGRPDVVKDRRKTAFVRNVPFRATEEDIVDFFSQCGVVADVVRKANAEGRLNTYCHVQFETVEGMERACQLTGSVFMGRELHIDAASGSEEQRGRQLGKPVEGCWFCLSNPNADTELVASIGEDCYLAVDKGAITDQHVLVLPVEHFPSSLTFSPAAYEEMERYLSALRTCFAASGRQLVGFERYMKLKKTGGNHAHVNAIAVPAAMGGKARQAFERKAAQHGFDLVHLPPARGEPAREALRGVVGDGEYFMALLPDGSRLVHPIAYGERHPLNYGREVLAELAGAPQRADWKNCKCSKEEEAARTERFKGAFQQYDVMQEG